VQIALDLGVPVSGIAEAVFARARCPATRDLRAASKDLAGPTPTALSEPEAAAFADRVEQALYASKIVSYTQGFHEITAGSEAYGWDIDLGAVASIWRGGCIIRAAFLDRITAAYDARPDLPSLLADKDVRAGDRRGAGRLACRPGRRDGRGRPGARLRRPRSRTTTRCAPTASRPRSRRASGTSSAPTRTAARTARGAFHTLWGGDRSEVPA